MVAGRQHEPGRPGLAVVRAVVNKADLGARRDPDRLLSGTRAPTTTRAAATTSSSLIRRNGRSPLRRLGYGFVATDRSALRRRASTRSASTSSIPTTASRCSTAGRPRRSLRSKPGSAAHGLALTDVRHLLLSHIHLDHAGAAGSLVRRAPGLTVWVSEVGAPHLDRSFAARASARRLYGESFDPLWGELAPVPEENVRVADGDVLGWEAFPTPATPRTTSVLPRRDAARGRCTGVRMPGASTCCRSRRRPTSTSRAGTRRRRDPPAQARTPGADPFRCPRGRRCPPRPARAGARPLG